MPFVLSPENRGSIGLWAKTGWHPSGLILATRDFLIV
jgi:hypothetical protein